MNFKLALSGAALMAGLVFAPVQATTLRWAAQNDILTLDPHSQNHATTNAILQHAYEGLTRYNAKYEPEPALATKWTTISPTQVRFELRRGVKFQDGSPFTADDVIFSFGRIKQPQGTMSIYVTGIADIKKVDEYTVDFMLAGPNPLLLRNIGDFFIMSKLWADKNKTANVQDYKAKEENYASRNVNGTGGYKITGWMPDQRVTMTANPDWWDKANASNVTEVVYTPIKADSTRVAALLSGDVDLVTDLPTQDVTRLRGDTKLKVLDGHEVRTIFIALDQFNPELKYSDVKGKNPFKDVRVRQAIGLAMDYEWMNRQLFYGIYKRVNGYFPNSEFHAVGLPMPDELALLEPLRAQLKPEVFGIVPLSPSTQPPGSLRQNLRQAQALLKEAGWTYRDGALRNVKGEAFTMEFLNDQPSLVRIVGPFQKSLEKLGISMTYRVVDFSLSKQKMDAFDFEVTTLRLPGSTAPGSELLERFGSEAARTPGSSNVWGIADPAVDALLQKVVTAKTRPDLSAAMRALDRVLTHGHYSVPQYYGDAFLIGYRPAPFVLPPVIPPYYQADTWAMSTWWSSGSKK
jgi:microcin C transport system substrate-binding protein